MAYNKNLAYDLSLFEDNTAQALPKEIPQRLPKQRKSKKGNIVKISDEQLHKVRRRKHNKLKLAVGFAFAIAVAFVFGSIIQSNVQLTELNQKIYNSTKTLQDSESYYIQLQMEAQSRVSPAVIDDYAVNKLGMSKTSNSKIEFVSLSQGDKAEILQTDDGNVFTNIVNAITSLWS